MPDQQSMSSKRFRERMISGRSGFSTQRPTIVVEKKATPVLPARNVTAESPSVEPLVGARYTGRLTLKDGKVTPA